MISRGIIQGAFSRRTAALQEKICDQEVSRYLSLEKCGCGKSLCYVFDGSITVFCRSLPRTHSEVKPR